ncbi:MAG: DUF2652 domain-containing protein, partial [Chloroflexi bacterium]|nr:DUF2652 domain-containing protein [Chloroflexota bacterium]
AVFAYASESRIDRLEILYGMIESTYTGYKDRLQAMSRRITCTCAACRNVSSLDLKFMVHHGEYLFSEIRGKRTILGMAPNFVRKRLWKESSANIPDWRGYVLITDATLQHLDQSAEVFQGQEFVSHETKLYGLNLEQRYQAMLQARRVVVSLEEADGKFTLELPISPPFVWEWLNDPAKRNQWYPALLKWSAHSRPGGLLGSGAVNHCDHGVGMVVETVLDWRPFEYFTVEMRVTPGNLKVLETIHLETMSNDRTRVSAYLRLQNIRLLAKMLGPLTARFLEARIRRIDRLVSNERLNKDR